MNRHRTGTSARPGDSLLSERIDDVRHCCSPLSLAGDGDVCCVLQVWPEHTHPVWRLWEPQCFPVPEEVQREVLYLQWRHSRYTLCLHSLIPTQKLLPKPVLPCGGVQPPSDVHCFHRDSLGGLGRTAGSSESHWETTHRPESTVPWSRRGESSSGFKSRKRLKVSVFSSWRFAFSEFHCTTSLIWPAEMHQQKGFSA